MSLFILAHPGYHATWRAAHPDKVKASRAAYNAAHPDKVKASTAAWRAANQEKVKATKAAWDAVNHDKKKAKNDAWRAANPDKIRETSAVWHAANSERSKVVKAAWQEANPGARCIHDQNRRARKLEVGGKLSAGLAAKLFKLQSGKCACGCGQPLGEDYHRDHRMPLALGGTNTDDNMQLLNARCNLQKGAKHPIDYMQQKGFLL